MRRPLPLVMAVTAIGVLLAVTTAAPTATPAAAQGQCGTDLSTNPAAPRLVMPGGSDVAAGAANTRVTVNGERYLTGLYQCGANKFGGVYVFFGWVQPGATWGPSHRSSTSSLGQFGITYHYPGDNGGADVRDDPNGIVRLVSFTAGGVSGIETPFHMDGNGNWSASLIVPGPVYMWKDPASGIVNSVDCRTVQCGIYTIGAHGIASRTNELFTPIRFVSPTGTPAPPPSGGGSTDAGAAAGGPSPAAGAVAPQPSRSAGTSTAGPATAAAPPTGAAAPIPGAAVAADPAAVDTNATTTTAPLDTSSMDRTDDAMAARGASSAKALAFADSASRTEASDSGGGSNAGSAVGIALVAALAAAAVAVTIWRRRTTAPPSPT